MPSEETVCPECGLPMGLMNPYNGPNTLRGPRKVIPHVVPRPKGWKGGRLPRCEGSSREVPDVAIYEVTDGPEGRRRRRRQQERELST